MAINPGDLATVVESGANGMIIHIDSDGSDSGTFYDVRLTGAGGSFPAGDVVRCARAEIDAPEAIAAKRGAADRFRGGGPARIGYRYRKPPAGPLRPRERPALPGAFRSDRQR